MPHATDDRAGGRGLAGFHASARKRHDRNAAGVELRALIQPLVPDSRRDSDALSEVREVEHHAQNATVEWLSLVGIDRVANAEHPADIEHLDHVTGLQARRHVARVAEQRLAMAEGANDDVAFAHLRHAAAGQLEGVVGGLVRQHLYDDHDAFFRGDVGRDAYLVRQATRLRHGGHFVHHHDRSHSHCHITGHRQVPFARSPARRWNTPVSETIFENPRASVAVHSPADSPYTPLEAAISE